MPTASGPRPSRPTLASPAEIPDLTGRAAVITGAGSGIGRAAAAALAAKGARVVLGVRDLDRGRAVAAAIGPRAEARHLDLASLDSVRAFVGELDGPVDYLVNNAGAMTDTRRTTADGFEWQLGVHHLGHVALTAQLLPRVTRRVVTVTSSASGSARIDLDDLQWERRPYSPWGAYGQSKLANLLFTVELQRRLAAAGSSVTATAANPGWAATGFRVATGHRLLDTVSGHAARALAQGPDSGALPTLLAAVGDVPGASLAAPRLLGIRGPATVVRRPRAADDVEVARQLWDVSEQLIGTRLPPAPRGAVT